MAGNGDGIPEQLEVTGPNNLKISRPAEPGRKSLEVLGESRGSSIGFFSLHSPKVSDNEHFTRTPDLSYNKLQK